MLNKILYFLFQSLMLGSNTSFMLEGLHPFMDYKIGIISKVQQSPYVTEAPIREMTEAEGKDADTLMLGQINQSEYKQLTRSW